MKKKFINSTILISYLKNNKSLNNLFRLDYALILDELSSKVYVLYKQGFTNDDIIKKLNL